jgi:hypothetical protein
MFNCAQLLPWIRAQDLDDMEDLQDLDDLEDPIEAWEGEGGSPAQSQGIVMTGTENQIAWADQIKQQVSAEFDRVRRVLESAARKQSSKDRADTEAIIAILEDKRAEVMARREAGYFIHDWQELRGQVRALIVGDSRYKAIKFRSVP